MSEELVLSPLFYVGNKFKLLPQLLPIFPDPSTVDTFYDVFGGSGVVSINVPYNKIIYNELDGRLVSLLKTVTDTPAQTIIDHVNNRVKEFNLISYRTEARTKEQSGGKRQGETEYYKFREYYNEHRDDLDLYTLTFFSFQNLFRFNRKGGYNASYGNQRWKPVEHSKKLIDYQNAVKDKDITIYNKNAFELLKETKPNDFVYVDPPYINTVAPYNENGAWTIEDDYKLFKELDRLNAQGTKFALSNVREHRGVTNQHLVDWAARNNYKLIDFRDKQYAAFGKGNANTKEVLIINY